MEYWSHAVLVSLLDLSITPFLQYSITPMNNYANHSAENHIAFN